MGRMIRSLRLMNLNVNLRASLRASLCGLCTTAPLLFLGLFLILSRPAEATSLGGILVLSHQNEPFLAVLEVNDVSPAEFSKLSVVALGSSQKAAADSPTPPKVLLRTFWMDSPKSDALSPKAKANGPAQASEHEEAFQNPQNPQNRQYLLRIEGPQALVADVALLDLRLHWGSGELRRDYVLLLNPPLIPDWVVQLGQSASAIALKIRPPHTSLNQVLVALKDKNADAFVNGNVNRLRAGVSLAVPNVDEVNQVAAEQAAQVIQQDNQAFAEFRESSRKNRVTSNQPSKNAHSDSLTLSRASSANAKSDEAAVSQLAKAKQEQAQKARWLELQKTAKDLTSIQQNTLP